jgi:hypothetical protein
LGGWYRDSQITFDFGVSKSLRQVAIYTEASARYDIAMFSSADISFSDDGGTLGPTDTYTPDHGMVGDLEGGDSLWAGPTSPFTTTAEQSANGARWIPIPVSGSGRFVRLTLYGHLRSEGLWYYPHTMISEVMFWKREPNDCTGAGCNDPARCHRPVLGHDFQLTHGNRWRRQQNHGHDHRSPELRCPRHLHGHLAL